MARFVIPGEAVYLAQHQRYQQAHRGGQRHVVEIKIGSAPDNGAQVKGQAPAAPAEQLQDPEQNPLVFKQLIDIHAEYYTAKYRQWFAVRRVQSTIHRITIRGETRPLLP